MVEDGDTDLNFHDLPFEAPRHHRLSKQFHTMHLRFDAAPTVVSTTMSPQDAAQISPRTDRFVSGNRSGADLRSLTGGYAT